MRVRTLSAALVVGLPLVLSGPAFADEKRPEDLAVEGIAKIMSALEMFISSIPMYGAPEVLPNGDIIIRRRNPQEQDKAEPDDSDDGPKDIKT